jgi:putative peptide zinc metalloprotease protein
MIPQEAFVGAVPALREDLRLHSAAPYDDGSPCWTIQDPITNQFYQIGWLEFELLSRWGLGKKDTILEKTNQETPLNASSEELEGLLEFLTKSKLVVQRGYEATSALIEESKNRKLPLWKQLLHNYLFFRVPIFHPDRFLAATYPYVKGLFSQTALWFLLISAFAAFYFTVQQFDLFAATFVDTLTLEGIAGYLVALIITKSLHELGHAYTATHFGTRVSHMGVAFVVMWPMLYTDTGETWRLKRSKHRLGIASAGVATELSIAVFALLAWNLTPDGPLRNGLFFLATTAWVISLLINVSPFLRFDGYYILSDTLNIPNLHQRAGDAAKTWLRRSLLGWDVEYPEVTSARRRKFYIGFAIATWIYRVIVFIGIAVAVYYFFFKALGIFLGIVEIWWFVLRPVFKEFGVWKEGWSGTKLNRKLLLISLFTAFVALMVIPWKSTTTAPAILESENTSSIYATGSGVVRSLPTEGRLYEKGDVLFEIQDSNLNWSVAISRSQKIAIEEQLKSLVGINGGESERAGLLEQWKKIDAQEKQVLAQIDKLTVVASMSGRITDLDLKLAEGVVVNDQAPLATLVASNQTIVEAFVQQDEVALIKEGNAVKFYTAKNPTESLEGKVISINQQRTTNLPSVALSAAFGGEVLVEADQEGLTPASTLYGVKIKLDQLPEQHSVGVGSAVINTQSRSLIERLFNAVASVFIREMSF